MLLNNWLFRFFLYAITGPSIAGASAAAIAGIAGGAIAAGGSIASGMMGSSASRKAAKAQEQATQAQIAEDKRQYDQTRADMAPYRDIGTGGLDLIKTYMGLDGNAPLAGGQGTSNSTGQFYKLGGNAPSTGQFYKLDGNSPGGGGQAPGQYAAQAQRGGTYKGIQIPNDVDTQAFQNAVDDYDQQHQARFGVGLFDPKSGWYRDPGTAERLTNQFINTARANTQASANANANAPTRKDDPNFGMALKNYDVPAPEFTPFADPAPRFTAYDKAMPTYKPFTAADMVNYDPGYKFRLAQGIQGVNNSGAARGMQLSGAQLKALDNYSQGLASSEFGAANDRYNQGYQNQLANWQTGFNANNSNFSNTLADWNNRYSTYNQNFATQRGTWLDNRNIFNDNRDAPFTKAITLANMGQGAAQYTASAGANATNAITSAMGAGANARAAGIVGSANAWGNALGNVGNNAMTLGSLYGMGAFGGGGGSGAGGGGGFSAQPGMGALNNFATLSSMYGRNIG